MVGLGSFGANHGELLDQVTQLSGAASGKKALIQGATGPFPSWALH